MAIETMLLDAGGVLVFPNWERVSETFARHGLPVSAAALRAAEPAARRAIDEPHAVATSSDADRGSRYFRMILEAAGVRRDAAIDAPLDELWAYHTEYNLWEQVGAGVTATLERLRALGVTLAVASNANGALQRAFDRLDLSRYFHAICDSCVEGVEKPDPRFFQIVLARAGGRPESSLHIGDLYHVDVVGARAAGIRPVLLDPDDFYAGFEVERIRRLADVVALVNGSTHESGRRRTPRRM